MQFELFDWRHQDTSEFETELTKGQQQPWKVAVGATEKERRSGVNIELTAPDGSSRHVMIEVDKGVAKILTYDSEHEEPSVIVFLNKDETHVRVGDRVEYTYRILRDSPEALRVVSPGIKIENQNP